MVIFRVYVDLLFIVFLLMERGTWRNNEVHFAVNSVGDQLYLISVEFSFSFSGLLAVKLFDNVLKFC